MSIKVNCLNPIAACGLDMLGDNYEITENTNEAEAILVRSAGMHDMDLPESLLAVARAGAGVNNIPLDACAEKGIVVFNTPGANANGVKELVIASLLLAARDITGGIKWCQDNKDDENIAKSGEKAKKAFAGTEIKGKKLGIRIGLWFNPSIQNDFADWQKDAQAIIGLYKKYGICCFKIDGLQIPTKTAEQNLRRLFDTVLEQTNYEVIFNLDATAGRRGGYHYMNEYGNIFLENRYTDWGNYYPYRTLRNLWMLSRYVPAEKMQIEFLNKWRNADKYDAADPFAPARYSFDYLFAITLAAQPLAWMEASNLPEEAYITASLLKKYQPLQLRFHQGVILPIGEEPSGRSWTGFQSTVSGTQGYLVVYREDNEQARGTIDTWLPEGKKVDFIPVMGSGKKFAAKVGAQGRVSFELNDKNSFALYQYEVKP